MTDTFQKQILFSLSSLQEDLKGFKEDTKQNFNTLKEDFKDFKEDTKQSFNVLKDDIRDLKTDLRLNVNRLDEVYHSRNRVTVIFGWRWAIASIFIAITAGIVGSYITTGIN